MISSGRWFDRKFSFDVELLDYPLIIERLRGTAIRIEDRIMGLSTEVLTERIDSRWSIQENVGHLLILENLWSARIDDLLKGAKELRSADLSNRATDGANFNAGPIGEILDSFSLERVGNVSRLEDMSEEQVLLSALHPRLKKQMRMLDLVYFVAEHDDHHLARISGLLRHVG